MRQRRVSGHSLTKYLIRSIYVHLEEINEKERKHLQNQFQKGKPNLRQISKISTCTFYDAMLFFSLLSPACADKR